MYARLHALQREQGISGHVAEVGVYQGRGFIPLAMLCGPQARAALTNACLWHSPADTVMTQDHDRPNQMSIAQFNDDEGMTVDLSQEGAVGIDLFEPPARPEDASGVGSLDATWRNIQDCLSVGVLHCKIHFFVCQGALPVLSPRASGIGYLDATWRNIRYSFCAVTCPLSEFDKLSAMPACFQLRVHSHRNGD